MPGIKEIFIEKLSKAAWYLKGPALPDLKEPARINFCIHTEMLYEDRVAEALLAFARDFNGLTGTKIAVCVTTPECPMTGDAMSTRGVSDSLVADRVSEIARYARIGYHGHFYRRGRSGLEQISKSNYDKEVVIMQIGKEVGWLKRLAIDPRIYIGGWWFLSADIVVELERAGIRVDASIRRGKTDTFGGRYLADEAIPSCGRPFMLPPSNDIVEIQSVFGPVMPRPIMNGHLSRCMSNDAGKPLYFIFPLHDWDIPKYHRNLWSNVKALSNSKTSVLWTDIMAMREMFLKERP